MPDESSPEWGAVDDAADEAAAYLETVTGLEAIQAFKRRSHRLLRPESGDRILDVGCGVGDDVQALTTHVGPEGSVLGIDKSESLIEEARSRTDDSSIAEFRVGDAMDLDVPDDSVDACRADRMFQHLTDPGQALAEMCRVTRPGGRVAVTDVDWGTLVLDAAGVDPARTESVIDPRWSVARHPRIGRRLRGLVQDAGLTEMSIDAGTVVLTDFGLVKAVFNLEDRLAAMDDADELSAEAADDWLAGVRAAGADDRLFAAISGVTVAGTVSGDQSSD
jgi:SAM-dependent methyltransferase